MLDNAAASSKTIVSLFDFTGNWSQPYVDAGYNVVRVDIKHGQDVLTFSPTSEIYGVLAAPPCTIWTNAASWMWDDIPDDVYDLNCRLIDRTAEICRSATQFWCIENPRGRLGIEKLGPHHHEFQPYDYGDAWSKRTCLWGNFHLPAVRRVIPLNSRVGGGHRRLEYPLYGPDAVISNRGCDTLPKKFSNVDPEWMERRREFRSATPPGFARAFFEANP